MQIFFFNHQVYLDSSTIACLVLDIIGMQFTLKCGNVLHLPISIANNLQFISTQDSYDKRENIITIVILPQ